jgi:hypothetical protein
MSTVADLISNCHMILLDIQQKHAALCEELRDSPQTISFSTEVVQSYATICGMLDEIDGMTGPEREAKQLEFQTLYAQFSPSMSEFKLE